MAGATDEMVLLERVFLRLGNAETDEQLEASISKFLPPVLLKLSSPDEGVRKKVMSLLIHITRRARSRSKVQLPVETLLLQYRDPAANSFIINFTIIYIKMGYPRMERKKRVELIPSVLSAMDGRPVSHQESLLLVMMPVLGDIDVPVDAERRATFLGLQERPRVAKQLLNFMLDTLLLPYGSVGQMDNQEARQAIDWSRYPVPPGLSEYAFKRVIGDNPPSAEELERTKLGIVKFIKGDVFPGSEIFIHLIVAAADTRFTVVDAADAELKRIVSTLNWGSSQLAMPLYTLFLGRANTGDPKDLKPEMKRVPANTRIRLKLLYYLCRVSKDGFVMPACLDVLFESAFGTDSNRKLTLLALEFTLNLVKQCDLAALTDVASALLEGIMKIIQLFLPIDQHAHKDHPFPEAVAYRIIGVLGQRVPALVNKDLTFLKRLFDSLETDNADVLSNVKDALVTVSSAFVLNREDECGIEMMCTLLGMYIESPHTSARSVAVYYAATVLPKDHAPSRYLLLLASGNEKNEISDEAIKALYGTSHKRERENVAVENLPPFVQLVNYVSKKMSARRDNECGQDENSIGSTVPVDNVAAAAAAAFKEIVTYLRLCLAKSAQVPSQPGLLEHPCEHTPVIGRYLNDLFNQCPTTLTHYLDIITPFNRKITDTASLEALLEVVGTIPTCTADRYVKALPSLRSLLTSTKAQVREVAAKLYAVIVAHSCDANEFESRASEFLDATTNRAVETQVGALVTLSWMLERKLMIRRGGTDDSAALLSWDTYISVVRSLCSNLTNGKVPLATAAVQGIGLIGKTLALPIPDTGEAEEGPNKKMIVETLLSIVHNIKMESKLKETAILSLGQLCVGENFPHTKRIVEEFIEYAKESKDIGIHLSMAESLVLCVQGEASPEHRDAWIHLPTEHEASYSKESNQLLAFVTTQLLKHSRATDPNLRQAVVIWLLALFKHNAKRQQVTGGLLEIQSAFAHLLSDSSEFVQDVAAKGLGLVYNTCETNERDELLRNFVREFSQGKREIAQVAANAELYERGELGKVAAAGPNNASPYGEICALASDLGKPELVYDFMRLANNNALWMSKRGAALGFSAIADMGSDVLLKNSSSIVPKLYRYQFDSTAKTQIAMSRIWQKIVPSTSKALEQYHEEILDDLETNLTNPTMRVRTSCCLALTELFESSAPIKLAARAPNLLKHLFRVMDDIAEAPRLAATKTTKVLTQLCVRRCDPSHGQSGELVLEAILPVLLEVGITSTVAPVRTLSSQAVSQLATIAGSMLKPSLVTLIPALLAATDLENQKLSYASTAYASQTEVQEAIANVRMATVKSHGTTETIKKCMEYIDEPILKDLMPKVIELMKSTLSLESKVAVSHFLTLSCVHLKDQLQPYAGKILSALANGLTDRSSAVRKSNAVTIGHVVGSAKQSSLDKLFNMFNTWYMEREDDSMRLAIGQTLQSINSHSNDIMQRYATVFVPLTFFAMHAEKVPGNENVIELWTDLWGEIAHGTEYGIRRHLTAITAILKSALESASWTTKAQAANAVSTVATKLGCSMQEDARNSLLTILVNGLQGRTWNGKERLVEALATLACNSKYVAPVAFLYQEARPCLDGKLKEPLSENPELTSTILDALYRESKKESLEYKRHAIKAFAQVLHALNIDRFTQLYDIAQDILSKLSNKNDDGSDDEDESAMPSSEATTKRREDKLKLQEAIYEALGKAWPSASEHRDTQDKYCVQFVAHCNGTLPNTTRPMQVAILAALNLFVDKLLLLKTNVDETSDEGKALLDAVSSNLIDILRYALGISKYTRIKKEALNIIITLSRRYVEKGNAKQLEQLTTFFESILPELSKDNQPEVRMRVADVKSTLKI